MSTALFRLVLLFISALYFSCFCYGGNNIQGQSTEELAHNIRNFRHDPVKAWVLLSEASANTGRNDKLKLAALSYFKCELNLIYHKIDDAYIEAQSALSIYKELKQQKLELKAAILNARVLLYKPELQKSIAQLIETTRNAEKYDYRDILAEGWNFLSVAYYMAGDLASNMEFGNKALQLYTDLKDSSGIALALEHLGYYYYRKGQYDSAAVLNWKSLSIRNTLNDLPAAVENHENLAMIFTFQGKLFEAQKELGNSIRMHAQYSDTIGLGSAYSNLGYLHFQNGDYNTALEYYNKSLSLRKKTNELRGLIITYMRIGESYERLGNPAKALEYFKIYDNLKDTLNQKVKQDLLSEMTAKYKLEMRDSEIKLLEENDHLNRTVRLFLIILSAFLAVLLVIIFQAYKNKRTVNRLLVNQNKEIQQQKEELETVYNQRNKFFSIISHDLRSPFHVFLSHTQILAEECKNLSLDEIAHMSSNLHNSAKKQHLLLEGLLEWAGAIRTSNESKIEKIDLAMLINGICSLYDDVLNKKQIKVARLFKGPIYVESLRNNVETLVRNILSNAVKYSEIDGEIEIEINSSFDNACIRISDHGTGMENSKIEEIFSGRRMSTPGTANEAGSGLGLQLCIELAGNCGGSIEIKSEKGKGTNVLITLPNMRSVGENP